MATFGTCKFGEFKFGSGEVCTPVYDVVDTYVIRNKSRTQISIYVEQFKRSVIDAAAKGWVRIRPGYSLEIEQNRVDYSVLENMRRQGLITVRIARKVIDLS